MSAKTFLAVSVALLAASCLAAAGSAAFARELANTGAVYFGRGEYVRAAELFARAAALLEKAGAEQSKDYASVLNDEGAVSRTLGRYDDAEVRYAHAIAIWEALGPGAGPDLANTLHNLALLRYESARYAPAEAAARKALAIRESAVGSGSAETAQSLDMLGLILQKTHRVPEALALYKRALSIGEHIECGPTKGLAETYIDLASAERAAGDLLGAANDLDRALAVLHRYPEDPVLLPRAWNEKGLLAHAEGNRHSAEALFRQALARWEKTGENHQPVYAAVLSNLAAIQQEEGKLQSAEEMFRTALAIDQARLGPDNPRTGLDLVSLGSLCEHARREKEAKAFFERAIAAERRRGGPVTCVTGLSEAGLGALAARHKEQTSAAERWLSRAAEHLSATEAPNDMRLAGVYLQLAALLRKTQDYGKAEEAEVKAMRVRVESALHGEKGAPLGL